jgi:hypothetical protein
MTVHVETRKFSGSPEYGPSARRVGSGSPVRLPSAEDLLREMAFVYQAARSVKAALMEERAAAGLR